MLMANLNRQGYREIKLHMILVEAMGTIYKDYTDKPLQTLIWITIRLNTVQSIDTQTERTLQQTSSALIKTRYALQYNTSNNSEGSGLGATAHNPPDQSKSKSLRWKSPACIKERLSTSAHTSQSPTKQNKKKNRGGTSGLSAMRSAGSS